MIWLLNYLRRRDNASVGSDMAHSCHFRNERFVILTLEDSMYFGRLRLKGGKEFRVSCTNALLHNSNIQKSINKDRRVVEGSEE